MWQDDTRRSDCQERLWDYFRARMREGLRRLLEAFMEHERDLFLACGPFQRTPARRGYRNGFQQRRLDTQWGSLLLRKPKVRRTKEGFQTLVIDRYQRRQRQVDQTVLQWIACGLSTREVSRALQRLFGGVLSAGGVSEVVAALDKQIQAFHKGSLRHGYRYVYFDAKHGYISHKRQSRGRGKKKEAVLLLAWGVRHSGEEELIDFRVADKENEKNWTALMTDLERRGVRKENPWGQRLQMIVTDGDAGLRAALWMVYPNVPKQRCVFHKIQDITEHLSHRDNRKAILASAGQIYQGLRTPYQAIYRLGRWAARWKEREPDAVRNFAYEFEDTLTYLNAPAEWQSRLKTTNPIERFIRELNKKYRKVGIFPSAKSWERATYGVWRKLQTDGYAPTARQSASSPFTPNT